MAYAYQVQIALKGTELGCIKVPGKNLRRKHGDIKDAESLSRIGPRDDAFMI
jgi:hypothetical protein